MPTPPQGGGLGPIHNAGEAAAQKGREDLAGHEAGEMGRGQMRSDSCTWCFTYFKTYS